MGLAGSHPAGNGPTDSTLSRREFVPPPPQFLKARPPDRLGPMPIDLADGTLVQVVVTSQSASPLAPTSKASSQKRTPAEILAEIAALPMQSTQEGFSGEDHDRILYGGEDGPR